MSSIDNNNLNNIIIGCNQKAITNPIGNKINNVIIGNNALYNQQGNSNIIITPNGSNNTILHKKNNIFTIFEGNSLSKINHFYMEI